MSREEIFNSELQKYRHDMHSVCNGIIEVKVGIEKSMDRYAKQECLEFVKWCYRNSINFGMLIITPEEFHENFILNK